MAALWCDDFKSYGTTTAFMLDGLYVDAAQTLEEDPDPLVAGNVYHLGSGSGSSGLRKVLPSSQITVGVAARYWFSSFTASAAIPAVLRFNDVNNETQISIGVTSTGALQAWRGTQNGGSGVVLGTTTGPVITLNAWNHIEVKTKIDNATGTVEIRVNGVTVLNLTAQDTQHSALTECSQIAFTVGADGGIGNICNFYLKDLFIWDNTGTHNNNFAGTVSVIALTPDSDVALTWALSGGATGFSLVNESPPVDTSFISAATPPPAIDKMGMTNLPADVTSVRALMTLVRARKTDGGDGNLQVGLISGASVDLGADRPITTAFTYYSDFSEEDPATVAPWLPTAVNAANIQFNRTL